MLVVLYKEHKRAAAVHRENADLQPCDDLEQNCDAIKISRITKAFWNSWFRSVNSSSIVGSMQKMMQKYLACAG